VRTLETRLKQIESLLRTAGVLPEELANEELSRGEEELPDCENDSHDDDDDPMNDDDCTYDQSSERTTPRTSVSSLSESNRDGDSSAHHLLLLKTWTEGEPRYIGTFSSRTNYLQNRHSLILRQAMRRVYPSCLEKGSSGSETSQARPISPNLSFLSHVGKQRLGAIGGLKSSTTSSRVASSKPCHRGQRFSLC
jgi:hypothetical protein